MAPVRSKNVVPVSKKREHQWVDARPGNPPSRRRAVLARQLQATGRGRPQLAGRGENRSEVVRGHGPGHVAAEGHRPVGAEEFGKAETVVGAGESSGPVRLRAATGAPGAPAVQGQQSPAAGCCRASGGAGCPGRSDQVLDFLGRRAMAARPARPLPNSSMIAGSGAGIRSEEETSRSTGLTPPG